MSAEFSGVDRFLDDSLFREWVKHPTPELDDYWNAFLENHPDKKPFASKARAYLLEINKRVEADYPSDAKIAGLYGAIEKQIGRPGSIRPHTQKLLWLAAACASGLLFWSVWKVNVMPAIPVRYEELVKTADRPLHEHVNHAATPMTIYLSDSSRIHLQCGARVSYPKDFGTGSIREVYLEGNAFFEIAKNPEKPFFVYSDELVTKVIGTSFQIKSDTEKGELSVAVVSGKVSVATREGLPATTSAELLLTPNQQALYTRKNPSLKKSLVSNPIVVEKPRSTHELEFDDTPALQIFRIIEKTYAVRISFDKVKLGDCLLTASLKDETLFEMLDLLCTALNARYFVDGTDIIVEGSGC